MRKIPSLLVLVFFIGCVQDPNEISSNNLFDVKVDNNSFTNAIFTADNTTRYTFELEAKSAIDNDKQISVSVSDGSLSAISNPTSSSSQTTLAIQGGKANFYYVAGRKPHPSALLSITLGGITQALTFPIKPFEPDVLQLSISPGNPDLDDDIHVTAYLQNGSSNISAVSEGLRVDFDIAKADASDPIEPIMPVPSFSNSVFDTQAGFVISTKTIQTNNQKGRLVVTATYLKEDGTAISDSKTVEFD